MPYTRMLLGVASDREIELSTDFHRELRGNFSSQMQKKISQLEPKAVGAYVMPPGEVLSKGQLCQLDFAHLTSTRTCYAYGLA